MDRIIKRIKIENYIYELGYDLKNNEISPRIEIYMMKKGKNFLGFGYWGNDSFYFVSYANSCFKGAIGFVNTIQELFHSLRDHIEIPDKIEKEYENIFLLYKLNSFKKI